jgi:DNA-binding HxlR family transcriptional regulator
LLEARDKDMTRTDFAGVACSIARSAAIAGDPWVLLIVRDVALGLHRFDELQRDLGAATNVLSQRLERLVEGGLLQRERYSQRPDRFDYHLTDKGRDLVPILLALTAWGDRWEAGDAGPPLIIRHQTCGTHTQATVTCGSCGGELIAEQVDYRPGPGGRIGRGTFLIPALLAKQPSTSPSTGR